MTRKHIPLFALLAAAMAAGAAPFVTIDFTDVEDGVAKSRQGNVSLHLDDGVKVVPGGPTGTPRAEFDGTAAAAVRVDARQAAGKLVGDEMAASFWFRPDRLSKRPIAFGFAMKNADDFNRKYSEAPFTFSLKTKPNDFGTFTLATITEGDLCTATGNWHHAAFRYSISNNAFTVWLDGFPHRDAPIGADEPSPIADFFGLPIARGLRGAIADLRVWNYAAEPDEIMTMSVSAAEKKKVSDAFGAAAASPGAPASFKDWCAKMAAKAEAFGDTCDVREWMRVQDAVWKLPSLTRLACATSSPTLAETPFLPISMYAFYEVKRLPFRIPDDAAPCNAVSLRAALGEYEAATFMAYPYASGAFFAEPTDLEGPGGARLPASVVDVRTVKFWHSHESGWQSYFGGGKATPVLTGEILLHDDAMLKVDREKHRNYIRLSYRDGERYADMSRYGPPDGMETFMIGAEPVHDAPSFVPMPFRQGDLSQIWITVHVPPDAKPGDYTGALSLSFDGKPAGALPVQLRVHPFKLPRATPRYNLDVPLITTWYHHIGLGTKLERGGHYGGGNSLSNACRRLLAEYRNLAAHNFFNPFAPSYGGTANEDLTDINTALMREAGLDTDPMLGDLGACDGEWCVGMGRRRSEYGGDISVEAHPKLFAKCMSAFSNQVAGAMQRMRAHLGDVKLYCYGIDEAGPETVRREMPFFATLQHYGGKAMISQADTEFGAFMADFGNVAAHIGRTEAHHWHEAGSQCGTYAGPFSGPESPEIWRRSMGIRVYMANYDAVSNYAWYEAWNVWNNFVVASRYGNFCIVYPTADGVVDTVGWEALREGLDDMRYLTLLRRLAREAIRSKKREVQRLGRRAYAWAELIDPSADDLDEMRAGAVERILALRDALKDVNTEKLYE